MQKIHSGECPFAKDTHTINIDYAYVPLLGTLSSNYKKVAFECTLSDECPDAENCPIYQSAPLCITE